MKNKIRITDLSRNPVLDVVIDGADQFDDKTLNLLKGGGGCLTQEKIVASATNKFIIIADDRKQASYLGDKSRPWKNGVPIEVLPLAYVPVIKRIQELGAVSTKLRLAQPEDKAGPVVTDNGNFLLDVQFNWSPSLDLAALDTALHAIPGVIETGFFLNMAMEVYMGSADGKVTHFVPNAAATTMSPTPVPTTKITARATVNPQVAGIGSGNVKTCPTVCPVS